MTYFQKRAPGGHLEFPNSFPDILSTIPTPMLNFKRIHQHLQLVKRERERSTDADTVAE
jgi:hypothetical protein